MSFLLDITFDERLDVSAKSVSVYANMGANGLQILNDVNKQLRTYSCPPLTDVVFKITDAGSGSNGVYVGPMDTLSSSGFRTNSDQTHYTVQAYKEGSGRRGECLIL